MHRNPRQPGSERLAQHFEEALRIHQEYAPQALPNTAEYDLDVLLGTRFKLQDRDVLGLFHIEGPAVSPPITSFDCIGIGRTVASSLLVQQPFVK